MKAFARFSLVQQLLAGGTVILIIGMLFAGAWVATEIESGVVSRAGLVTGLYVESFVSPRLQSPGADHTLSDLDRNELDRLLGSTALGQQIVLIKV